LFSYGREGRIPVRVSILTGSLHFAAGLEFAEANRPWFLR
jgi:hypothetical protein